MLEIGFWGKGFVILVESLGLEWCEWGRRWDYGEVVVWVCCEFMIVFWEDMVWGLV